MATHSTCFAGRAVAAVHGESEGPHLARRDPLAVQQLVAVAGLRLQRVAEGVAEIEQRAQAAFPLVAGDHGRLGPTALQHGVLERGVIPLDAADTLRPQPPEEARAAEPAVCHPTALVGQYLTARPGGAKGTIPHT